MPKADGAEAIHALVQRMQALQMSCPIMPIATETAAAIFHLGEYATVADHLLGLTWGAEDLCAAIGAESRPRRRSSLYRPGRNGALAGAVCGACRISSCHRNRFRAFRDLDGLAMYAQRAARDGFTGMMAIHPTQIPAIHAAFTPSPALIEHSRRIVAAFAQHPGAGVLQIDGAMVDAPHLKQAQRVLLRAAEVEPPRSP